MNLAISDGDVAGPKVAVIPGCGVTPGRIIRLYTIELLFRFINTIPVNAISTDVDLLARRVFVVGIWNDVEAVNYDSTRKVKTNVIEYHSVFCLSSNC